MLPVLVFALVFGCTIASADPKSDPAVFESYKNTDDTVLYSEENSDRQGNRNFNNRRNPGFVPNFQANRKIHSDHPLQTNLHVSTKPDYNTAAAVHRVVKNTVHDKNSLAGGKPYAVLHGTGQVYPHDQYAPGYNTGIYGQNQFPGYQYQQGIPGFPVYGFPNQIGYQNQFRQPSFNTLNTGFGSNSGFNHGGLSGGSQTFLDPNQYRTFQNQFIYGGVNPSLGFGGALGPQGYLYNGNRIPSGNFNFRGYLGYPDNLGGNGGFLNRYPGPNNLGNF